MARIDADIVTLPAHWAVYAAYGDANDEATDAVERLAIALYMAEHSICELMSIEDTERFTWSYQLYSLGTSAATGGTVCDYILVSN